MADSNKSNKGKKYGRNIKHQSGVYKATGRLEKNAKRRRIRHVRSNPFDKFAHDHYWAVYGVDPHTLGLNAHGHHKVRQRQRAQSHTSAHVS